MKNLLYVCLILVAIALCAGCNSGSNSKHLKLADSLLNSRPDSSLKLLNAINDLSDLTKDEQMQFAWNKAQAHFRMGISMIEDTLLPHAIVYYRQKGDSSKLLTTYLLEARYLQWLNRKDSALAAIDNGLQQAIARKDTFHILLFYQYKAETKSLSNEFSEAAELTKEMLRYPSLHSYQRYALTYKLGVYLSLLGDDNPYKYFDQSIEMALAVGDTNSAFHYLRNYADYLASKQQYTKSNELTHQAMLLSPQYNKSSVLQMALASNFINLHQIDSAKTYWEIAWKNEQRLQAEDEKNQDFTRFGILTQLKGILDYAEGENVDINHIARFSDSIMIEMKNQQNTIVQQLENRQKLHLLNYELTIGRQRTRMWLVASLILLIAVAAASYAYIRNRYKRLAEAEDRIDTLKRLLEDAQKVPAGNDTRQTEDDTFFKKILLQQLGIIRLVATTPTSQNQTLLKQISAISNHEIPVDSLLIWSDLYPVIDKLYNGFYTQLMDRYGTILSDKEVQICCLLCAKFSTKEIGVITQQSSATIYVRKSSIRKKLGMEEKQDIIEFLQAIQASKTTI